MLNIFVEQICRLQLFGETGWRGELGARLSLAEARRRPVLSAHWPMTSHTQVTVDPGGRLSLRKSGREIGHLAALPATAHYTGPQNGNYRTVLEFI